MGLLQELHQSCTPLYTDSKTASQETAGYEHKTVDKIRMGSAPFSDTSWDFGWNQFHRRIMYPLENQIPGPLCHSCPVSVTYGISRFCWTGYQNRGSYMACGALGGGIFLGEIYIFIQGSEMRVDEFVRIDKSE